MSLQPELEYHVPEQTARIAKAAFPKSTLCMKIYDYLGTIFRDQDFADLFPQRGQPAQSPFRLALVTILQFVEGLSDRAAADCVRARIDWKYLLCLELDDQGFDYSVLCEFRIRLLESGAEQRLFDKLLELLREKKLVKARGRQRTDATHVIAAIRYLNRLERVGETLRAALNALATIVPEWVRLHIPSDWIEYYGTRVEEYKLPHNEKERAQYADKLGADGYKLLDMVYAQDSPIWLREVPAIETMRLIWLQNYQVIDGIVRLRDKDNLPPPSLKIDSPYDTEARYSRKRSIEWVGYKVHITETCDEGSPHIITNVETDGSLIGDNNAIPKIHKSLSAIQLLPELQLVDTGYTGAKRFLESRQDYGIDLLGPTQKSNRWQAQQGQGFDSSYFEIDWQLKQARCPAGKVSSTCQPMIDGRGNEVINVVFLKADCIVCPSRPQCTTAVRRTINIKPQPFYEALKEARIRQESEEFKAQYKKRAGIEGTISQAVRAFGLRRSRYLGAVKTHLQDLVIGAAINLVRLGAWLSGKTPETTRQSAFSRVMQPIRAQM